VRPRASRRMSAIARYPAPCSCASAIRSSIGRTSSSSATGIRATAPCRAGMPGSRGRSRRRSTTDAGRTPSRSPAPRSEPSTHAGASGAPPERRHDGDDAHPLPGSAQRSTPPRGTTVSSGSSRCWATSSRCAHSGRGCSRASPAVLSSGLRARVRAHPTSPGPKVEAGGGGDSSARLRRDRHDGWRPRTDSHVTSGFAVPDPLARAGEALIPLAAGSGLTA
jgi:hypothetical protein